MGFSYIDIVSKGCEGWLNLFFDSEVIAMINNVELANKIRSEIHTIKSLKNKDVEDNQD